MAIYHLSARPPIARAQGRASTAAAAYRAGACIVDARTGLTFDYRRKRGVVDARIQLPTGIDVPDRATFWNHIEQHHRRRDAVLAREVVVALPIELSAPERWRLALEFARDIADQYGVAVDCALHEPSRDGDDRNHHAHLLLTACSVSADGTLGTKVERLDPIACRHAKIPDSVSWLRPHWEQLTNAALARGGSTQRVDHRSHRARGISLHPTIHVGRKRTAVRIRGARNALLRQRNAAAVALEEQIQKLSRMRARLEARGKQSTAEGQDSTHQGAASLSVLDVAERALYVCGSKMAGGRELSLPWRRRNDTGADASHEGGSVAPEPAEGSVQRGARGAVARRRRP